MEFFIVRLKQLSSKSALILQNPFQSSIRERKLFWYKFHSEYVALYSETAKINLTARSVLFFIELLSKSAVSTNQNECTEYNCPIGIHVNIFSSEHPLFPCSSYAII
ncbi:hypothetical protein HUG17_6599 [Dermatophagoides farinae]|uniref:Uncharacterized protein n=1 Tax=Dermatophagoides farinae TaxID=6954 RepID=A0A9D4P5C8_DERFA|nr:hypothetical protein HUG17_6599 [Dermatophagoides farinae]